MNNLYFNWKVLQDLKDFVPESYELVSLDIFDTLLHRTVYTPKDVFKELYRRAYKQGIIENDFEPDEFALLRSQIEVNARKSAGNSNNCNEVTFDEIWDEAPDFIANIEQLKELELNIEYEWSFPNPYITSLINDLLKDGIIICLTSDTYFSKDFICKLLTKAGFDTSNFTLFISSEYQLNKSSGKLFSKISEYFLTIPKSKIIHIGDNLASDFIQARSKGINAIHLSSLSTVSPLYYRNLLSGIDKQENPMFPLIQIGDMVEKIIKTKNDFFYNYGMITIGPILSVFALWVIHDAMKKGITLICPIMREGILFGKLLKSASKALNAGIEVREFYTSRKAAFLPFIENLDKDALKQYFSRRGYTLSNLIEELDIPQPKESLQLDINIPLRDIKNIDNLNLYLFSDEVQIVAAKSSLKARQLINNYTKSIFNKHQKIAMLDIGPGGNTLHWLRQSLGDYASVIKNNYLLFAVPEMIANMSKGNPYSTFFPMTNNNTKISRLMSRSYEPIEIIFTGRYETTLGYAKSKNKSVIPLLGKTIENTEQEKLLEYSEIGVMKSWEHLEHCIKYVNYKNVLTKYTRNICALHFFRLIEMPTSDESNYLGDLYFDDNAGSHSYSKICDDNDKLLLKKSGSEAFLDKQRKNWGYQTNFVRWPQAVVTQSDENYITKQYISLFSDTEHQLVCRNIINKIVQNNIPDINIYGAGEIGFTMLKEAQQQGVNVNFIVDSNAGLHGVKVLGKQVVSLKQAAEHGSNIYIIASVAFAEPIEKIIQSYYSSLNKISPNVYSIWN